MSIETPDDVDAESVNMAVVSHTIVTHCPPERPVTSTSREFFLKVRRTWACDTSMEGLVAYISKMEEK